MKNSGTSIGFRTNLILKKKIEFIAYLETRDASGQINHILKSSIKKYEKENDLNTDADYQEFLKYDGTLREWLKAKKR